MKKRKHVEHKSLYKVFKDHQSRTCIWLREENKICSFIPMEIDEGFVLQTMTSTDFHNRFKELIDYPIEKACQLFFNYAKSIGATEEVVNCLSHIISITQQEADMAIQKSKVVKEAKEKKTTATRGQKKTIVKGSKFDDASVPYKKVVKTPKTPGSSKPLGKVSKPSAATMFKELIMAGKMTDEKIFEAVQKEFGLDDNKKGYVKWYRNDMIKKGVANVPAALPV